MNQRILIAEQLLADAATWQMAASSMRMEAAAMLSALVADCQSLPDVAVTVLLSSALPPSVRTAVAPQTTRVDVIDVSDAGLSHWFRNNSQRAAQFSARLLIAPESDGLLHGLLSELDQSDWSSVRSLNLPVADIERFSDKLQTAEWLIRNSIPAPATILVSDDRAVSLLRTGSRSEAPRFVLKPRSGAGSDRIHLVAGAFPDADHADGKLRSEASWILQPRIAGVDCSIGMIGGGESSGPVILPPARQTMVEENGQLQYVGGEVPYAGPGAAKLSSVAARIAERIGRFSGYVGIDAVIPHATIPEAEPMVIEINPRLCTSYLGYRRLSGVNLASIILGGRPAGPVSWRSGSVVFRPALPENPLIEGTSAGR